MRKTHKELFIKKEESLLGDSSYISNKLYAYPFYS